MATLQDLPQHCPSPCFPKGPEWSGLALLRHVHCPALMFCAHPDLQRLAAPPQGWEGQSS